MSKRKFQATLKGELKSVDGVKFRQEFIIGRTTNGDEIIRSIYGKSLEHILIRAEEHFSLRVILPQSDIDETPKPRERGTGSVFRRADGRWTARFYLGQKNGKRDVKVFYGYSEAEVVEKLEEFRAARLGGGTSRG